MVVPKTATMAIRVSRPRVSCGMNTARATSPQSMATVKTTAT